MDRYSPPINSPQFLREVQLQCRRSAPLFQDVYAIRQELRERRKQFLGSHISLCKPLLAGTPLFEARIHELVPYLASRTAAIWDLSEPNALAFCTQFYELSLYAIGSGEVGDESVDDIIQLAECLIRSKDTFVTVMKKLLPADMIGALFHFTEAYPDSFYSVAFEDAVLGAVSILLGALADPLSGPEESKSE